MGMSFSEYINRLRVNYATQLMKDTPEMSTNEVAFRSGFSSLASFYSNFKTYQNCPPLTYKRVNTPEHKQKELKKKVHKKSQKTSIQGSHERGDNHTR